MPYKINPFQVAGRYQITYAMGSGDQGKTEAERFKAQQDRFKLTPTQLMRLAIKVLEATPEGSACLKP